MIKHILGQAVWQCVWLFLFVFLAPEFMPEDRESTFGHISRECMGGEQYCVMNGMIKDFYGEPVYATFEKITPSRHLTIVFNLFVFLQIFNMLAARKIDDELWIFEGLCGNFMFVAVVTVIFVGQIAIVLVGSFAMSVHVEGLTPLQWGVSIGLGFTSLIWNVVLKFLPDTMCPTMGNEKESDVATAEGEYQDLIKKARELSAAVRKRDLSNSQRFIQNKQ